MNTRVVQRSILKILAVGTIATAFMLSACSSGSSANPSSGANADDDDDDQALPGDDAAFEGCDRQNDIVSTKVCGGYEDLWTCPSGRAKPAGCTLSTEDDSFCCPPTNPVCTTYCAANDGECQEPAACEFTCAFNIKATASDEAPSCVTELTDYLKCVAEAGAAKCKDGAPFAATCEELGEALITCQSKGNFVRAPDQDDKCAARPVTADQKKRSRAYVAKAYGYSGSCADYNDDDQFTDGETFCCSYP